MRAVQPWLWLFIVFALTLTLGVACGDDATSTPASPTSVPVEPTPVPTPEIGDVNVVHQWVSGGEPQSFAAMTAPWEEFTGGEVVDEGTRDLLAILTARVEGGNPPDIAALAAPGSVQSFARSGDLVPLDPFLDMDKIRDEYSQAWIDLCTVDGNLYCVAFKASNKSTIWYSPKVFAERGWSVPTTWDELIALSEAMKAEGLSPWSVGVESGGASGWPGTDWIGQLVLSESGPDVYDRWLSGELPWTDPAIKSAWEKFGEVVMTDGYVPGGSDFALATNFVPAAYLPFNDPPQAGMYFLGSFTQGFVEDQFPDLTIDEDYSFFPFPTIDPQYSGAVVGGADFVVMFKDNPSSRSLVKWLATAAAQQIWVAQGGFTSTNNEVSLDLYPDALAAKVAEQLTQANIFRFDADDTWGGDLQAAFWKGILDYLSDPADLDDILRTIDTVAQEQLR